MLLVITLLLFVFIIGLCIGSFLNVVILRALSNESIVFPASKCPKCQHPLLWWHNIPVLSYILLRGKCRFCKEKISIQYPIIELLTGIAFVLAFLKYGLTFNLILALIIISLFIVIAGTDWREKVVFDVHTYSLMGIGLFCAILTTGIMMYEDWSLLGRVNFSTEWFIHNPITVALLGLILGFVGMEIISRLGYLFAGSRAFGEGDSFIAAGLGTILGWQALIPLLILSVMIQIVAILPVFIKKEIEQKNWMTIISLGTFTLYTVAFLMAQNFGWLSNMVAYIASSIVLAVLGLLACREILTNIKNDPENRTYFPFGPALVLAGFILMLF